MNHFPVFRTLVRYSGFLNWRVPYIGWITHEEVRTSGLYFSFLLLEGIE